MNQYEYAKLLKALHKSKVEADKAKTLTAKLKTAMQEDGINRVEAGGHIATISTIEKHTTEWTRMKKEHPKWCEGYAKITIETRLNLL